MVSTSPAAGPDGDELLLGAQDHAGDRDLARLAHRLEQQPRRPSPRPCPGPGSTGGRRRSGRCPRGRRSPRCRSRASSRGDRVELLGRHDDVALLGQLEALDDLLVGHLLLGDGVHALLGDAVARVGVELVEADGLARDRRVELDRHVDQSEGDRAAPDRPWHRPIVTERRRRHAELQRARAAGPRARTSRNRRSTRSWRAGSRRLSRSATEGGNTSRSSRAHASVTGFSNGRRRGDRVEQMALVDAPQDAPEVGPDGGVAARRRPRVGDRALDRPLGEPAVGDRQPADGGHAQAGGDRLDAAGHARGVLERRNSGGKKRS